MDEQVTAQAAAVLRFKQFIELHISERVIAKYDDGRPMGNDADIFLEYLQGVEQRLVAAEARVAELAASGVSYGDPNVELLEKLGVAYHRGYTDGERANTREAAEAGELFAQDHPYEGGEPLVTTEDNPE